MSKTEANSINTRGTHQEIDALLCTLFRIATTIHEDSSQLGIGDNKFDLVRFEMRAKHIALLRHISLELQTLNATIMCYESTAYALHQEEMEAMQTVLADTEKIRGTAVKETKALPGRQKPNKIIPVPRVPLSPTGRPPLSPTGGLPSATGGLPSATGGLPSATGGLQRVGLVDGIVLEARVISEDLGPRSIFCAINTPELYYIPRWNHFAFRVGPVVFHGNIGNIYSRGSKPKKVKECRHWALCPSLRGGSPCDYYHDPATGPNKSAQSQDVRNYLTESWLYAPASRRYVVRYGPRRIGSRDSLYEDLQSISSAESRRLFAQISHDVLCAIVIAKYTSMV